jgi:hypothetical protein
LFFLVLYFVHLKEGHGEKYWMIPSIWLQRPCHFSWLKIQDPVSISFEIFDLGLTMNVDDFFFGSCVVRILDMLSGWTQLHGIGKKATMTWKVKTLELDWIQRK